MKLKYAIECLLLKTEMETFARNEFNFSWRFIIFSRCFCRFELVNFVRTCGEVEDEGGEAKAKAKVRINFINYYLFSMACLCSRYNAGFDCPILGHSPTLPTGRLRVGKKHSHKSYNNWQLINLERLVFYVQLIS